LSFEVLCTLGFYGNEGKEQGLWLCGHVSFVLAVIVANIVVLMNSNIHNLYSFGFFAFGLIAMAVAYAFESNFIMFA